MSVFLTVTGVLALAVAALMFFVVQSLRRLGTPTRGAVIDRTERTKSALIVIDVQEDFTRNTLKHAFDPVVRDAALATINREVAAARDKGQDVAFVKNIFRDWAIIQIMKLVAGGIGTPGREGLKLDRALEVESDPVFEKSIGDSFSDPRFEAWLAERKVGRLKLVGLDACHCVQLTAKGALSRGYQVDIFEPGTLTGTPAKWPAIKKDLSAAGAVIT